MAKAKKIKGSTTINITKKTKDTTYVIDESVVETATVNFVNSLPVQGMPIPAENSDDLCLLVINDYKIDAQAMDVLYKYVIITVKDYYKYYNSNPDLIQSSGVSVHDNAKKEKDAGNYLTHKKKVEGTLISNIAGDKKNTTYNITQITNTGSEDELGIMDIGGNDKYTVAVTYSQEYNNGLIISEINGNDKYIITDGTLVQIKDSTGKDTYNIKESCANIDDISGNDKYTLTSVLGTNIVDYAGKDKYTISDVTKFTLRDLGGSDTYKLTNVETAGAGGVFVPEKYFVADKEGNEKYTITGSDTNLLLVDGAGKDTYNIKGTYDKKTKTATYVGHTEIKDEGLGKNTFNVNYGEYTRINTQSNINTFNIKNSDFTYIGANTENNPVGKDTYNLDTNADFTIYDYGASGDSYTLKKSNNGYVCDYNGNDKYTISNMVFNPKITEDEILAGISIDDRGGTNDTLTLKTTKKDNIVYMSDFGKWTEETEQGQKEYIRSFGNSLIIYDKSTQGFVEISNFYSANENYTFTGFGNGVIETIKASKKKLDVSTNEETMVYLDTIKEDVVDWLVTQSNQGVDFTCVEDVLIYGTADQKAILVNYFDPNPNLN